MRRVSEFDSLRGLAVLGVLLFHLKPNEGWTQFGMTGVHLFLVLSGYLITQIVINHVDAPNFLRAFYARRILRIWPIYYLMLGFLVLYQLRMPNPPSLRGLPYYLTFTQYTWRWPFLRDLLPVSPPEVDAFGHTWTLAMEEQFYLIWPLALALFRPKRVVPLALGIIGFGLWFKTLGYDTCILPSNFGAFALGGLIAPMLNDRARVERNRLGLSMFFLTAAVLGFVYVRWYFTIPVSGWSHTWMLWRDSLQQYGFYTLHFGIVGFVATNAGSKWLAPLRMKELTYLGEISYGVYLYHMPVYWLVGGNGIRLGEPWTMWVTKIALTIGVAILSYRYIEKPILTLKDWFPYNPRPAVATRSAIPQPQMMRARPSATEPDRVAPGGSEG